MTQEAMHVMRLLGALFVAIVLVRRRAAAVAACLVSKIVQMEKGPPPILVGEAIASVDPSNQVTQINPPG
jgi:hypothetical protein